MISLKRFFGGGTDTKFDDIFTNTKETEQNAKNRQMIWLQALFLGKKQWS